ncbi:MAG: phosphotransferase [Pseudomonadales bacterium]|nr:phosphotransferase [Pseudomonadales bacterium]
MTAPAALLEWAADVVGTPHFERVDALAGGSASAIWRLVARTDRGPMTVVAKQLRGHAVELDAGLIGRELRVLEALRPLGLPVPEPLASDPDGICSGRPALLMSLMEGELLQGADALRAAIPEYVAAIVHWQHRARDVVAGRRFEPWFDLSAAHAPGADGELWARAAEIARRFPRPAATGFIHRDPHPANMLFSSGRLTGVIDWPHAGRGPRGMDVSRVAINLACTNDVDATRELRERWEHVTGERHDPLLDVYALLESVEATGSPLPAFEALGVHLDGVEIRRRREAFLADTLRRMTVRRLS